MALLLAAAACSGEGPAGAAAEAEVWVDVGTSGGADGLAFERLEPGGPVPLYTFGQGGTHALLAVRCHGLGERAFVSLTITNPASGSAVTAPAGQSPRLLACESGDICELLPLLVMTGGLVPPGADREGLSVVVRAEVSNLAGTAASAEREAVLQAAAL